MRSLLLGLIVAAILPATARADSGRAMLDQDVARDSMSIVAVAIGTTFVQVDTPKLTDSWMVEVQNTGAEPVCCSFDSGLVGNSSATNCIKIDTAATAARASANDWKRWKRWAQNLSLYCRKFTNNGSNVTVIVTQGR